MKSILKSNVPQFLCLLKEKYDVFAPVKGEDGTRFFNSIDAGALAIDGGQLPMSPAFIFFPPSERLFAFSKAKIDPAGVSVEKPILIFGLSAADAAGLIYTDKFFTEDFIDDLYTSRRTDSVIITYVGETGAAQFDPLAEEGFDLQFVVLDEEVFVFSGSKVGEALLTDYSALFNETKNEDEVRAHLNGKSSEVEHKEEIDRAAALLKEGKVNEDFWEDIAKRCICCGSCRQVCPTCTCFDVWDWSKDGEGTRFRSWDTCILEGFTREASGHNPRQELYHRYRRIIEHKLKWDPERWGVLGCVKCGRCDDVCPTNIGIYNAAKEIIRRFGGKN